MGGWMDVWMDGWMDGLAGLRIAYSNQKETCERIAETPGPASSVEDRSLRKISFEGTAVRSPPRVILFRRELIRKKCLTETFQHLDGFFQSTQPRLEKAVAAISTTE